jgi:hypothetical protein
MNKWMKSQCSERKIDSDNSSLDIYSDLNISKDQDNPQSPDNDTALEKPI